MAIPSGAGTEVIKTSLTNTSSSSAEQVLINGVANHIYTIISIVICNTGGSPGNFDLYIDDDGGGTDYYLTKNMAYPQYGTFIFNETVHGQTSGVVARVKDFKKRTDISPDNPPVELRVSLNSGAFRAGEVLVGSISSARYIVDSYDTDSFEDPFDANSDIETEADNLLDFTEGNPFGDY